MQIANVHIVYGSRWCANAWSTPGRKAGFVNDSVLIGRILPRGRITLSDGLYTHCYDKGRWCMDGIVTCAYKRRKQCRNHLYYISRLHDNVLRHVLEPTILAGGQVSLYICSFLHACRLRNYTYKYSV